LPFVASRTRKCSESPRPGRVERSRRNPQLPFDTCYAAGEYCLFEFLHAFIEIVDAFRENVEFVAESRDVGRSSVKERIH
jgi:hypothetical protein